MSYFKDEMHKNSVKFGRVVSEICEWTDRQTYSSQYLAVRTVAASKVPRQTDGRKS